MTVSVMQGVSTWRITQLRCHISLKFTVLILFTSCLLLTQYGICLHSNTRDYIDVHKTIHNNIMCILHEHDKESSLIIRSCYSRDLKDLNPQIL